MFTFLDSLGEDKKRALLGYPFIVAYLKYAESTETFLQNLEIFESQILKQTPIITGNDLQLLKATVSQKKMGQQDLYGPSSIIAELDGTQSYVGGLLRKHGIIRIIISFSKPIRLYDYQSIVDHVKAAVDETHDATYAESIGFSLQQFLKKEILGVYPFQHKRIVWKSPVQASSHIQEVYAVEGWLIPSEHKPHSVLIGIFGLTKAQGTRIQNQDALLNRYKIDRVSAAFTYHKGFRVALGLFFNSLGRNLLDQDRSEIEKWFDNLAKYGVMSMYRYETDEIYSTSPFSTPLDVIFYPHPQEFGAADVHEIRYLEHSLKAKCLIKCYFERITERKFPVYESEVRNWIWLRNHRK